MQHKDEMVESSHLGDFFTKRWQVGGYLPKFMPRMEGRSAALASRLDCFRNGLEQGVQLRAAAADGVARRILCTDSSLHLAGLP
ncbi:hypothetical protein EMGBD1_17890 [Anaerolineaceae bacterium]|nr:hypothetical protein EMGBD1_17890 [Anaerolineaceae bacterium]